jgi:hypothetical protein
MLAIVYPIHFESMISKTRHTIIMIGLLIFSNFFYLFIFLASFNVLVNDQLICQISSEWYNLVNLFTMIDTLITIILPFFIISLCNAVIIGKLAKPWYTRSSFRSEQSIALTSLTGNIESMEKEIKRRLTVSTRTLLIVSLIFLVLNFPYAIFRIWQFNEINFDQTNSFIEFDFDNSSSLLSQKNLTNKTLLYKNDLFSQSSNSEIEEALRRTAWIIYYIHFAVNFLLYNFNESKFKLVVNKLAQRSLRKQII